MANPAAVAAAAAAAAAAGNALQVQQQNVSSNGSLKRLLVKFLFQYLDIFFRNHFGDGNSRYA